MQNWDLVSKMNWLTRLKRKILGSKRQADYMRQFHKRKDGNETILSRVAQTLWYGQLASHYTMPIGFVGYDEEHDCLSILIDGIYYDVILKQTSLDE